MNPVAPPVCVRCRFPIHPEPNSPTGYVHDDRALGADHTARFDGFLSVRTGSDASDRSKALRGAAFGLAFAGVVGPLLKEAVDKIQTQATDDLRELLVAIEDAGEQGALDPENPVALRLVNLGITLRERYPE